MGILLIAGVISGVVTFEGTPAEAAPVDRTADPKCGDAPPAGSLVGGVLVRIENGTAGEHAAPEEPAVITQTGCEYTPRVVGIVEGQAVEVRNGDPTFHNVRGNRGERVAFNHAQQAKAKPIVKRDLGDAGDVVSLHCDVHPWMQGWIVVHDHPYFTVTSEDGSFALTGVPPGTYTVEAWHPTLGLQTTKVKVKKGKRAAKAKFVFRSTK